MAKSIKELKEGDERQVGSPEVRELSQFVIHYSLLHYLILLTKEFATETLKTQKNIQKNIFLF
jgi:hypothetical protein